MISFTDLLERFTNLYSETGTSLIIHIVIDVVLLLALVALYVYFAHDKELSPLRIILILALYGLLVLAATLFALPLISWGLKVLGLFLILIPVFSTPDLRRKIFGKSKGATLKDVTTEADKEKMITTLVSAVLELSRRDTGALITIECEDPLNEWIEKSSAVKLDAQLSEELLWTIFYEGTALHDGAVIIRGGRVAYANIQFDPTKRADVEKHYGMRHRAGIGISEDTDSVTIIVSEETRAISVCIGGSIYTMKDEEDLHKTLEENVLPRPKKK